MCSKLSYHICLSLPPVNPDSGPAEPPTVYLWALYLFSQHYNMINNSLKALELINTAIDHTPTEVQLYMLKAKILKVGMNPWKN